ncbi:unnamed protein product, partial [Choristocarpus tenellus]
MSSRGDLYALERSLDDVILPEGKGIRVHCLSDMHTDYTQNLDWIRSWQSRRGASVGSDMDHEDVLLVAGDISSHLD